jgi:hypothetical protein
MKSKLLAPAIFAFLFLSVFAYIQAPVSACNSYGQTTPQTSEQCSCSSTLPTIVNMSVAYPGLTSYVSTTIWNSTLASGSPYVGWCVNTANTIVPGAFYPAYVISSYSPLASAYVTNSGNLTRINYVVNHYTANGTTTGPGIVTAGDIQFAIWMLITPNITAYDLSTIGSYDTTNATANAIVADAMANGANFVPCYGQVCLILLVPTNGGCPPQVTAQVTAIQVKVTCQPVCYSYCNCNTCWPIQCTSFVNPPSCTNGGSYGNHYAGNPSCHYNDNTWFGQ